MTILDHLLHQLPTASRTTLRKMLADQRVLVNGLVVTSLKEPLDEGDAVKLLPKPTAQGDRNLRLPFAAVFEDADLIVIDKPHGLITSSGARDRRPTAIGILRAFMKMHDPRAKVGLVHRLDADAAGLLILSKNSSAHASLKSQFFHHSVERLYMAIVQGIPNPPAGRIDTHLVERADGTMRITRDHNAQRAITHYETIESRSDRALLRIKLETGRKHQIRAQLAQRGWPIENDVLYNPRPAEGTLKLAAVELEIDHPRSGKRMRWKIEAGFQI